MNDEAVVLADVATPLRRLGAYLLDALLLFVIVSGPAYLIGNLVEGDANGDIYRIAFVGMTSTYFLVGNSIGETLGKRFLGIRIVRSNGVRPGSWVGAVRSLPHYLALSNVTLRAVIGEDSVLVFGGLAICAPYATLLWDRRRQNIYDKIAGTFVVRRHQVHQLEVVN